jgi:hypothetical protein
MLLKLCPRKVQEGYEASFARIISIIYSNVCHDIKDKEDWLKCLPWLLFLTIPLVGNTMREALTSFKNVYNMSGNKINQQCF